LAMKDTPLVLRRVAAGALGMSFLFTLLASSIVKGTTYNTMAHVYGAFTFSMLSLMVGCVVWLVAFQRRAMPVAATVPLVDGEMRARWRECGSGLTYVE
jgi:hypothetical protein